MKRCALLGSITFAVGCVQPYIEMSVGGDSGGTSSSTSTTSPEEIEDPEPSPELEEGGGGGDDADPSAAFIDSPDGGGHDYECDAWAQDCPTGEKCNWWANDGGGSWNATRCVPIDPDPDEAGELCTVVENGVSGIDSCVLGAICWDVEPGTNQGECVAFCTGSEANPLCPDPTTNCVGRGPTLCLPTCCPIEQTCDEGEGCYGDGWGFYCTPDAGGETGAFRDNCEYINVCDPGLFCAGSQVVPACQGSIGCCTPFCDLNAPDCDAYDPQLECIAWYEEGQAPPGEEHIGGCMIPE